MTDHDSGIHNVQASATGLDLADKVLTSLAGNPHHRSTEVQFQDGSGQSSDSHQQLEL